MSSAAILVQAGPSGPSAPPQSFSSRALSRSGAGSSAPYFSSSPDRAWDSPHLASDPTTITIDEDRGQLAASGSSSPGQLDAGPVLLASAVMLEESSSSRSSFGLRNLGSSSFTAPNVVPATALAPRGRSWLADNIAEQQDEDNELERPPRVWMLGNRSGSCDSVGTESSSLTTSSSSSELTLSSATGSSTSLPPVTSLPRIRDPSDTSATSSPASSPILGLMPEPVAAGKKAKKAPSGPSGGGGFGVLKEWLSGSSSSFKKGREKAVKQSNLAPPSVAEIVILSARVTAPAPAAAAPIAKAPVEIMSNKLKDQQRPFEDASPPLSPSSAPSNELAPAGGAARSASKRILAPLQTFPFASAFRSSNSTPVSPADSAPRSGSASPVLPTTLFPSGQQQQLQPPVPIPHLAAAAPPISTIDGPKAPPQLSPLQSLHLLSSQKLSLLVRPPTAPHPLFVAGPFNRKGSVSLTSASSPCSPSAGAYGGLIGSTERRFPSSTNPYAPKYGSRRRERASSLVAELGLRSLMQRLEKGGRASRAEVEALTRLFRAKPVSLLRDQASGNFIASIGEPLPTETVAPANISSSALRAATVAPAAGSGILAFLARPRFKERVVCWQRLDDSYGDIVEVDIETARYLGVAELELSRGIEAMAKAIKERALERPTSWFDPAKQQPSAVDGGLLPKVQPLQPEQQPSSTSPSTPVAAISPLRRTSPSDQPRLASEDVAPVPELPDMDFTTKMPTSVPSALLRSPVMVPMLEEEESTFLLEPPTAIWQRKPQRSNSDSALPAPTGLLPLRPATTRLNPLARQSFPYAAANRAVNFPGVVEGSAIDEGEDEDDELPLSFLKHRSSFGLSLPRKSSAAPQVDDDASSLMLLSPPIISSSLVPSPRCSTSQPSLCSPAPRERVRFSSEILARDLERDTREAERRAYEEKRHAREEEEREQRELERALEVRRQEEAERRKQDRIKAEVGAARRRREEAKIGARTREIPESGHWDEVVPATSSGASSSAGSSSLKPAPLRRSETARTITESTLVWRGGGLARPEFEERRRASMYAGGLGGASRPNLHIQANPVTFQERPPSLISTTATSSPQTMSPRSSVSSSTPPRPALYHAKSGLLFTAPSGLQPSSHHHKSPSSTSTATPTTMHRSSSSFARPSSLSRHPSWHSTHAQPPLPGSLPLAVPPLLQPALPTAHLHLAQLTSASSYPQLYVPSSTPQVNLAAEYYGGVQPAYNPYHPQPHPYHAQHAAAAAAAYHYHHHHQHLQPSPMVPPTRPQQAKTISHRTSRQSLLVQPQAQQQALAHRRGSSGRQDGA